MNFQKKYKEIDYNVVKKKIDMLIVDADNGMERMRELENKVKSEKEKELFLEHKHVLIREWRHFVSCNTTEKQKLTDILRCLENIDKKTENSLNVGDTSLNVNKKRSDSFLKDHRIEYVKDCFLQLIKENNFIHSKSKSDTMSTLTKQHEMDTSLPQSILAFSCHDKHLKSCILKRFVDLDINYGSLIKQLQELSLQLKDDGRGQWSEEDDAVYQNVKSFYCKNESLSEMEYNSNLIKKNRLLCMDMLVRMLTHKTRQQIIDYEKWCEELNLKKNTKKNMLERWMNSRKWLEKEVLSILKESNEAFEKKRQTQREVEEQRKIFKATKEKLDAWKTVTENENLKKVGIQEQSLEEQLQEKQKNKVIHENKLKEKLLKHQELQHKMMMEQKLIEEKDTEIKEKELKERLRNNKKRVEFRKVEMKNKMTEKAVRQEEEERIKKEKDLLMQEIIKKWRPEVKDDLMRMFRDTECSKAKKQPSPLLKKLDAVIAYDLCPPINTFTDDQIISDPRFRVEERLRQANLITHDHARNLISSTKPLFNPRKDTFSQVLLE